MMLLSFDRSPWTHRILDSSFWTDCMYSFASAVIRQCSISFSWFSIMSLASFKNLYICSVLLLRNSAHITRWSARLSLNVINPSLLFSNIAISLLLATHSLTAARKQFHSILLFASLECCQNITKRSDSAAFEKCGIPTATLHIWSKSYLPWPTIA